MANLHVTSITGEETMLEQATLAAFKANLHGELLCLGDTGYDNARKVYNGMINRYPQLIAYCANVADVIAAVNFARENKLLVAVRSGGHSGAGLGICDGGLVVDLSRMKGIRIDPVMSTVRVEAGCTWKDVDHATHAFGLAVPSGIISSTGVAGLTLGGGHGYLTRKYGLTIDNLLEADVVLANGCFVIASADQNEDLFWAIRGGGGNFGVVTSFLFRGHPISTVYAGPTLWHLERAVEVMQWYREFIINAPEDIYGFFTFLKVPPVPSFPQHLHTQTMCGIIWCYTGLPEQAEAAFQAVRKLTPAFEHIALMPYPAMQSMFDPLMPSGMQWYWKGDFVNQLSDEVIALHVKYGSQLPTLLSTMHLYPINGAANRVGKQDTAFSFREATWSMALVTS